MWHPLEYIIIRIHKLANINQNTAAILNFWVPFMGNQTKENREHHSKISMLTLNTKHFYTDSKYYKVYLV